MRDLSCVVNLLIIFLTMKNEVFELRCDCSYTTFQTNRLKCAYKFLISTCMLLYELDENVLHSWFDTMIIKKVVM